VVIQVEGERSLQYQVVTDYYAPWSGTTANMGAQPQAETMRIDVRYDRTELAVNDTVNVTAEVELLGGADTGMLLVDLGIPPGFSPITGDLDVLVAAGRIDRYELTARQIILYLTDVSGGEVVTVNYRLFARFPIRAQTPSSQAYDYYTPSDQGTSTPQRILVKLGTPEDG
jgi:CD109 antigen